MTGLANSTGVLVWATDSIEDMEIEGFAHRDSSGALPTVLNSSALSK